MKVARDDLVELFEALGWAVASKWNREKMTAKLVSLVEVAKDENGDCDLPELGDEHQLLLGKLRDSYPDVEIVKKREDVPADDVQPVADATVEIQDVCKELGEVEPVDSVVEEESKPKKALKEKKASVNRRPKSESGPDLGTLSGVRSIKNRRFVAGIVIRKRGLEAGVMEEMVKEVDEQYGTPNPKLSKRMLIDGWHIVNGFVNG